MFKDFYRKLGIFVLAGVMLLNTSYAQNIITSSGVWFRSGAALLTNPSGLDLGTPTAPMGDIHAGTLNVSGFSSSSDINLPDDVALTFGTSDDFKIRYETADTNSNNVLFVMPEGDATNSSSIIIGDASIDNADLAAHNGKTEPGWVLYNDAADKWIELRWNGTFFQWLTSAINVQHYFATAVNFGSVVLWGNDADAIFGNTGRIGGNTVFGDDDFRIGLNATTQAPLVILSTINMDRTLNAGAAANPALIITSGTSWATSTAEKFKMLHDTNRAVFTSDTGGFVFGSGTPDAFASEGNGDVSISDELEVDGAFHQEAAKYLNPTTVNAATYDLLATDNFLAVDYTGTGAVTSLTLPTAQCNGTEDNGRDISIKDTGGNATANNITIDTEGSETIDGSSTLVISNDFDSANLVCYSSNWYIK